MEAKIASPNKKNYLQARIKTETYVLVPVLLYIIYITYYIHNSNSFLYNRRKINFKTLSLKKKLLVTLSAYFIYQAILTLYMGEYLEDGDEFLSFFTEFLKFSSAVITPFVIIEQAKKQVSFYFTKIIQIYWIIITLVIFYEFYIEIRLGVFFKLLTLSSIGLVTSTFFCFTLVKYPRDKLIQNSNNLLAELQLLSMISENTINQNKKELKDTKYKSKNQKNEPNPSESILKRKSDSTLTANVGLSLKDEICLDEINQNQPEKLPHYPKIDIKIKNDYKFFKNKSELNTANDRCDFENSSDNFNKQNLKFISNFYFQIIVVVKDKNINQTIKRSIKDFLNLDECIKNEFDGEKYLKKLIDRLPRLKIPKRNYNNSLDFFNNYKINFEMYLRNILNEPSFITNDVLEFLNIYDHHMAFSYDLSRKNYQTAYFYRIKDDILTVARKKSTDNNSSDDESLFRKSLSLLKQDLTLPLFNSKHSRDNSRIGYMMTYTPVYSHIISPKSNKIMNLNNNQVKLNNKIDILEINNDNDNDNEYNVSIRFSQVFMFKLIKKKLSEIMKLVNELFSLNKNNENLKNLIRINCNPITQINFTTSPSFSQLLENVLQNAFDNLKLYKTNQIISDFFLDFMDSNFVSRGESFLLENKNTNENIMTQSHCQDSTYTQCKSLIEKHDLIRVTAAVPNFVVLSHNFKPNYFYIVQVEIELGNGKKEKIVKKFTYKELRQYIDFIKVRMNLSFNISSYTEKSIYNNIDDKIQKRMAEITKSLNIIFSNPELLKFPEWIELFTRDKKYRNIISNQNGNDTNIPKPPSLIIRRRTESKESLFNINIRESIL